MASITDNDVVKEAEPRGPNLEQYQLLKHLFEVVARKSTVANIDNEIFFERAKRCDTRQALKELDSYRFAFFGPCIQSFGEFRDIRLAIGITRNGVISGVCKQCLGGLHALNKGIHDSAETRLKDAADGSRENEQCRDCRDSALDCHWKKEQESRSIERGGHEDGGSDGLTVNMELTHRTYNVHKDASEHDRECRRTWLGAHLV